MMFAQHHPVHLLWTDHTLLLFTDSSNLSTVFYFRWHHLLAMKMLCRQLSLITRENSWFLGEVISLCAFGHKKADSFRLCSLRCFWWYFLWFIKEHLHEFRLLALHVLSFWYSVYMKWKCFLSYGSNHSPSHAKYPNATQEYIHLVSCRVSQRYWLSFPQIVILIPCTGWVKSWKISLIPVITLRTIFLAMIYDHCLWICCDILFMYHWAL